MLFQKVKTLIENLVVHLYWPFYEQRTTLLFLILSFDSKFQTAMLYFTCRGFKCLFSLSVIIYENIIHSFAINRRCSIKK